MKQFIQDESFRAELAAGYNLFIFLDDFQLTCAVATHGDHEFAGLENWVLGTRISETSTDELSEYFHSSAFLQHDGYRNIVCCIAAGSPLFIPNPLFEESMAADHLKFASGVKGGTSEFIDHLRRMDASAVYTAPSHIVRFFKGRFSNIVFHHAATAMVEYLLSSGKNNMGHLMTVHFSRHRAGIFVTNGKTLELCNYFDFETPEEMVYYLVFVCEQLHLNTDSIVVNLTGEINSGSQIFTLASKYIRNIAIGDRPAICKFTAAFDELPPGDHFNLFAQSVCVS